MFYTNKFIDYYYREQFQDLLHVILQWMPMLIGVLSFNIFTTLPHTSGLVIGTLIGIILYFGFTYWVKSHALLSIVEILSVKYPALKKLNL